MEFELYHWKTGKMLWTQYYSHTQAADGREVTIVVQALERNVERGLKEVVAGLNQYFVVNQRRKA